MWPWGHLALGYLLYGGYRGVVVRRPPAGWPVVALALGTQFPDLVDKPLAYWFGVLPEGRTLTHTFLVIVPACLLLLYVARRMGRGELGVAFAVGWLSHPLGDAYVPLLRGEYEAASFLLWPVLPAPDYETESFLTHGGKLLSALRGLDVEVLLAPGREPFVLELWLAAAVFLLWAFQGMPPAASIARWVVRR